MTLEGRIAIVTGAGRNIGEALCHALAGEGARVAVADLDPARCQRVAADINEKFPERAMAVVADVSSSEDVQRLVAAVVGRFGGVDVLINNAAVTDRSTLLELDEAEWDRVLGVTLKGVFLCCKHVARQMVEQGRGGHIINMASTSGHRGRADATAYTAAKGGVLNLTRSLAVQLATYKIRVNSLTPNQIGSPVGLDYIPESRQVRNLVGRQGMPEDVTGPALFLLSEAASFINGADLLVDGGVLAGGMPFSSAR